MAIKRAQFEREYGNSKVSINRIREDLQKPNSSAYRIADQLVREVIRGTEKTREIEFLWRHVYSGWELFCMRLKMLWTRTSKEMVVVKDLEAKTTRKVSRLAKSTFGIQLRTWKKKKIKSRINPEPPPLKTLPARQVLDWESTPLSHFIVRDLRDPSSLLNREIIRSQRRNFPLLSAYLSAYGIDKLLQFLEESSSSILDFSPDEEARNREKTSLSRALLQIQSLWLAGQSYDRLPAIARSKIDTLNRALEFALKSIDQS